MYAQLSPGYRDNLVEKGITLSREGQSVYEPLNIEDGKMYFIVYEINNNSEILWYKLYYIRDIPYNDTGYISVFWDSHPRTTIRYNKESNGILFFPEVTDYV